MASSEELNVDMDETSNYAIAADELKLKLKEESRKKRQKRSKLGMYQSRKMKTKLVKRIRKGQRKRNLESKQSMDFSDDVAEIQFQELDDNISVDKLHTNEDSIETIAYSCDENVERKCPEDNANDDILHDITDACMSALSHSFCFEEAEKVDVGLGATNATNVGGTKPNSSNLDNTRNISFQEDISDNSSYKDRCLKKLRTGTLLRRLVDKLDEEDCLVDFMHLLTVLLDGILPIKNIPFLLCLDLAKFVSLKNTSGMKYRMETKKFWEAVYKFGGAAMLRMLSGLKNFAQVFMEKSKKGFYDPKDAEVNFAVPDINVIRPNRQMKIPPGFIQENISKVDRSKQYNLAVDGKKVGPGCTGINEGDINLLGFEGPPSLSEQNERLEQELGLLDNIIIGESQDTHTFSNQIDNLPLLLRRTSKRIKDMRTTQVKNERLRSSFQKSMAKDPSQYKKCNFGISSIDIYQFFSNAIIERILDCNKKLCYVMSKVQGTNHMFSVSKQVDLNLQENACVLIPPENIEIPSDEELLPQYVKQGTKEWKELRKKAFITGSTMYKALGLDTVKEQTNHYKQYVTKEEEQQITPELQKRFDHGHECETHAFATFAGVFLPAYFPICKKITELGSFYLDGEKREQLMEISPDALITSSPLTPDCLNGNHGTEEKDIVVEIKSPMGERKDVLPVHYKIPKYYIPQVLAEMKVLGLDMCFYASYSKESMVILSVHFDEELWNKLWDLTAACYDHDKPERITRVSPQKEDIINHLEEFIERNCAVICELPSCTALDVKFSDEKFKDAYHIGRSRRPVHVEVEDIKDELLQICEELKVLMKEVYEMERKKATEMVMFVLNDTDRMYKDKNTSSIPIAYVMKGYSLDVETMRKIVDTVRQRLLEENIDVICESYDGQWANLAFKGHRHVPLTKIQLQRNVWSKLGRITKENLLKMVASWTRTTTTELDLWSTSFFLTVGKNTQEKLSVEFAPKGTNPKGRVLSLSSTGGDCSVPSPMTKIHTPLMKDRPDIWFDEEDNASDDSSLVKFTDPNLNVINLLPSEFVQSDTLESAVQGVAENAIAESLITPVVDQDFQGDLPEIDTNESPERYTADKIGHNLVIVNPHILEQVLVGLCSERRGHKWQTFNVQELYEEVLMNQKQIEQLTSYELDVIDHVISTYIKKHLFHSGDLKSVKVKAVCKLFGRKRQVHARRPTNTKRVTLRGLCTDVIKDVDYPTNAVAVAIANMLHQPAKSMWIRKSTKPLRIKLPDSSRHHESFSYPEFSYDRNQVEFKMLDYTHILTNVRTHICNKGYKHVKKEAFLKVSEVDNDVLNRAFIVDSLDKQSAAIALKFFSERVQEILLDNGFIQEARFVKLFRNWHNAIDERGINVTERLEYLQDMADYLSELVNFDVYPPQKQYIAGIPIVTFECLMQNITARIQLYSEARNNMYNHRSISTLSVETLFSHMSRMHGTYNGCPRAVDVSKMLQTMVEMENLQSDPTKAFTIHVTNKKKYPDNKLMSEEDTDSDDYQLSNFRNHKFDKQFHRTRKKRVHNVELSKGNKPMRRIEPVRVCGNFKIHEGHIKSTTRHGLPDK